MKRKSKEDDSLPYSTWVDPVGSIHYRNKKQKSLTPVEALRLTQLRVVVDELRTLVFEYFLVRASFSNNLLEKKAFWILATLLVFVERNNRFPKIQEQIPYLNIGLGLKQVPELPPLRSIDIIERSAIEAQMRILKNRLLGLDRESRKNPSDRVSGKES